MEDTRLPATPEFHGYRPLPSDPEDSFALVQEMIQNQRAAENGATFFRVTAITPEHPQPPYPEGLWVEGWRVDPGSMRPPRRQADFAPPITLAEAA